MERIINQIHKLLIKKQKTIAVAESCTGGLLSGLLTQISGSSRYFIIGIVAYSNKAKEDVLRISRSVIVKNGVVSKTIAILMAGNIRKIANTDFGIGVTGIAGPTGATAQKPVGTVFIAITGKNKTICKKFHLTGNRNKVRNKAALKALALLKTSI